MWSLWLGFCDCGFCFGGCEIVVLVSSVCLLMHKDKRFCKFPDARAWLWGKLGLALGGRAMLRNSLIQLSADEWGCAPSFLVVWLEATSSGIYRLYGEANGNLQKDLNQHTPPRTAAASSPVFQAGHCWSTPSWENLKYSQAGLTQSFLGTWILSFGSWCTQGFVCALQESLFSLVLWKFCFWTLLSFNFRFPRDSQILCRIPRLGSLIWSREPSQQCKNVLSIIVLHFVSCPPGRWVKNLPANAGNVRDVFYPRVGRSPSPSPEKSIARRASILFWRIPWTKESGRLQSMGLKE